jgi:uncharacterized protein (DUF433 family)
LIVETSRGPSIAGTRITVFSVMDSLKSEHSRDLIKQLFLISDEQLDAVLEYISAHRTQVEEEYAEIVRRSQHRRAFYEPIFRERSPLPGDASAEERRVLLRQRLVEKQAAPLPKNEHHDSPRSRS